MILKIEDFSSFLSIFYLGLSILTILVYEWSRKESFDPFSGIILFSVYSLFELVFVPLVRVSTISDFDGWSSWYDRAGWLDNGFVIYATTFNAFAYWLFVFGYYGFNSKKVFQRNDETSYRLRQRSHLWISIVVSIAAVLLIVVQVYWLTALGEGINLDTILRRAIFERAAVYSVDPALSFAVSMMQILAGIATIVILSAFVPLYLNTNSRIHNFIWFIAASVVIIYGVLSGYRLPVVWAFVTPFVLSFYFGGFSFRKLKKTSSRAVIAFSILIILLSHFQSRIGTTVLEHGDISWSTLTAGNDGKYINKFLNNTIDLLSRDTFDAILGIMNYYEKSDYRLNGQSFIDMISSIIPRRIWSGKKMVYGSDEITYRMDLPLTTHTTIGIHGELFANFGYAGVTIMIIYGAIFSYIDRIKRNNEVMLLLFATYIGVARALVHFDFGFTGIFISTYTALLYWIVLRILFYKKIRIGKSNQAIQVR
jgi:oligosaccharide repeat unit polymerase